MTETYESMFHFIRDCRGTSKARWRLEAAILGGEVIEFQKEGLTTADAKVCDVLICVLDGIRKYHDSRRFKMPDSLRATQKGHVRKYPGDLAKRAIIWRMLEHGFNMHQIREITRASEKTVWRIQREMTGTNVPQLESP